MLRGGAEANRASPPSSLLPSQMGPRPPDPRGGGQAPALQTRRARAGDEPLHYDRAGPVRALSTPTRGRRGSAWGCPGGRCLSGPGGEDLAAEDVQVGDVVRE